MKQTEIKPCVACNKGVMHDNNLAFYRLSVEHLVADVGAIQRQAGLEMMLGGNAGLANIMGADEDMAKTLLKFDGLLLCQDCATKPLILEMVLEKLNRKATKEHEE